MTREMRDGDRIAGKAQPQESSEGSAEEPGLAAVSIRAPHVLVNIELGAKERTTSPDSLLQTLVKHQLIPGRTSGMALEAELPDEFQVALQAAGGGMERHRRGFQAG